MIKITATQAMVYHAMKETGSVQGVMSIMNYTHDMAKGYINRLVAHGLLERIDTGIYRAVDKEFTVRKAFSERKTQKIKQVKLPDFITPEIKACIFEHYGKMPRRKLAERTGLPKVDLNNAIIALGLSKEKCEVSA